MLLPLDHNQYVEADKGELCSKASLYNFLCTNQLLKFQAFPKAIWQHVKQILSRTCPEIASFCSDFNAGDMFNSERHVRECLCKSGPVLRTEITTQASEIAIHTKYDRTYRLFRVKTIIDHNSTILGSKIYQYKYGDKLFFGKAHGRCPRC